VLVRRTEAGILAIGQASHAWLSGQLAAAWGNDHFPRPEPRQEVLLAAAQHDIGWVDWDRQPTLDPQTGWPQPFTEGPELAVHIEMWRSAPDKLLTQSAYAALLVSMHGTALYARRDPDTLSDQDARLIQSYLTTERERQDALRAKLDPDEEELARNQRLIWTWDSLSLAVCIPWDPHTATRVPGRDGPVDIEMRSHGEKTRFRLAPWPFAEAELTVRCEARRLARPCASAQDLHAALAAAPPEKLEFTLTS
jgi:hypothetical protein